MDKKKRTRVANYPRRPRLSVSMIVRNEEQFLPGCLESLKGLADEIILVDTGSIDSTITIAKEHGAKIHAFPWIGDFSAARNESLRHCTGEWVLYLDADERVAMESRKELLRIIRNPKAFAFYCLIKAEEWLPKGPVRSIAPYPRLFRRFHGVCFEGRVHEQVIHSIRRSGHSIDSSNVVIEHLGYTQSQEVIVAKCHRNIDLLRKQLTEYPDDVNARFQLGNTLGMIGFEEEGISQLKEALGRPGTSKGLRSSILNGLARLCIDTHRLDEAVGYGRSSLREVSRQVTARWLLVTACMAQGDFHDAVKMLKEIVVIQNNPNRGTQMELAFDATIPFEQVFFRIGICFEQLREIDQATEAYFEGLQFNDTYQDMLERFLRCVEESTDIVGSMKKLSALIEKKGESASLLNQVAHFHLKQNELSAAEEVLVRLSKTGLGDADTDGLLIGCLVSGGELEKADEVYRLAESRGSDSHLYHKAALRLVLLRRDMRKAVIHLEKLAQGVDHGANASFDVANQIQAVVSV
jgi:tetratricopeptide (TPR) repeat protein